MSPARHAVGAARWGRGASLAELGEAALIARIARAAGAHGPQVALGIGDDAALLAGVGRAAWTVDTLVEDVDFRRRWAAPADVGHKAAAVSLSDLAAMGARPRGILLSVAARADEAVADVVALARAAARLARPLGAPLVGGDVSATAGPLVVTVSALGEVQRGRDLLRGGGRLGDQVVVTGALGGAAAGLALLEAGRPGGGALKRAQLRPQPHLACGRALAALPAGAVRALVDVSDGLAVDAARLAGPGCEVALDPARLPWARGLARLFPPARCRALALGGGEDFVLAAAIAPAQLAAATRAVARAGGALFVVGEVVARRRTTGRRAPPAAGFAHFRAAGPGLRP